MSEAEREKGGGAENAGLESSTAVTDLTTFMMADVYHLQFYGFKNGFFEKLMQDFLVVVNIEIIALNYLVYEKIALLYAFLRQTNKQTNKWIASMRKAAFAIATSGGLIRL